jgi:LCP family protein required for cell wall assembly
MNAEVNMRGTRFFFAASVIMLVLLSANGIYFMLSGGQDMGRFEPEPISGGYTVRYGTDIARTNMEDQDGKHDSDPESIPGMAPVNLMLLGLDRDKSRCDVIMLLNFDPETSDLNVLSIARDTRIRTGRSFRKINSLYSKGGEKRVAEEISTITGLPVHYYITADFKGFRKIIDTLGGVEFYVPFRMNYDDPTQNLHIHLKKGLQVLDGRKAEQLVRYRKGNYKGQGYIEGDIGRIKMQQDFIKALIDQKLSFRYLSKADDVFAIIRDYVKTNITLSDIARYAGSAAKIRPEDIKTFVLPGESCLQGDVWWYIYDREQAASMIAENFRLN